MDSRFNNDEFESFLRYNANQYPMYPSDKVWKGVHASLHTHRKWYAFTALGSLLLLGGFTALLFLNSDTKSQPIAKSSTVTPISNQLINTRTTKNKNTEHAIPVTKIDAKEKIITTSHEKTIATTSRNTSNYNTDNLIIKNEEIYKLARLEESQLFINAENKLLQSNSLHKIIYATNIVETNTENSVNEEATAATEKLETTPQLSNSSEFVQLRKPRKRFNTQLYFIPTISYRKLSENNNSTIAYQGFGYQQSANVKDVVNHKPDLGFEFGIGGRYRVNNNLFITTGLQFNITRYDIRASYHPTEIATVALNSRYRTDSMASLTNYRNFNGGFSNWIENFYFQAALPIGLEVVLASKNKFQWGFQGSLQPTYVIGDRAYLISSDYKNYAKFPNLMRRWNLSSSFGTFVAYTSGRIDWQFGPTVRYQHLSSFTSKYPVKENLFDVGFKVAATFNKK